MRCDCPDVSGALRAGRCCCVGINMCHVCKTAPLLPGSCSFLHFSSKTGALGCESMGANAFSFTEINMKFMDRKRNNI